MRVSAKVDYAVRAGTELAAAAGDGPVKGERIATAQEIPLKFLENILLDLRTPASSQSQRGAEGGYWLARPAAEITLAEVIRAVEGPLANVRGERPEDVEYTGVGRAAARRLDRPAREPARRARDSHARGRRRAASCPTRSAGSLPTRTPGSRTDTTRLAARAHVDDLAALELELLGLVAGELRGQVLAVLAHELDPHLEAEVDDPLDHRLGAPSPSGSSSSSTSCGRTKVSPSRLTGPTKLITNSFAGCS